MPTLAERLLASAARDGGVTRADRLAVAVSGGVDSTVLLRTLAEAGWPLIAVHVHHGLRAEADADAAFVVRLGGEVGVDAEAVRVEVGPGNVQAEAREARYAALEVAARRHGCAAVVTAHTATDQAETVLMNLIRGAGLRGLGGMAPRRPLCTGSEVALVRPMLEVTRAEVEAEAVRRGWTWREDASNATGVYRRNRIRRDVLPLLDAEGGPGVAVRIARAAATARAALGGPAPGAVLDAHGRDTPAGGRLDVSAVAALPEAVRALVWAEALHRWAPGATASGPTVERIDALLDAPAGRRVEAGGAAVWREAGGLSFGHAGAAGPPLPSPVDARSGLWAVDTEVGTVWSCLPAPGPSASGPDAVRVDADRVPGTVTVRPWADGDRIRPVGMDGSKRVSDLLRERGVPASVRRSVLVVAAGEEVLWVVGHRLSRDVAATDSAVRVVEWAWAPRVASGREGG